jgi:hypothetical protein
MNSKKNLHTFHTLSVGFLLLISISCNHASFDGKLIVTRVPSDKGSMNMITGDAWRFVPGAQIILVDPGKPSKPKLLTGDFYSACSPDVSWDGMHMMFAAQQKENDPWQIWEMDLKKGTNRKITSAEENCTDPVYLPVDRLVFTKTIDNGAAGTGHALFACNSDGTDVRQITFHPHGNFATTVLKDGRLLAISRQLYPSLADPVLMVIRPDGTKGDLFYRGAKNSGLLTRGYESSEGLIYFIESDSIGYNHGNVVCINYNRPLHSRLNLSAMVDGEFNSVFPGNPGKLYVSYRKNTGEPFAVYEFDVNQKKPGKLIYKDEKQDITEVIFIQAHQRPKKLPSEVDMGVKTGQLLCQDINFTGLGIEELSPEFKKASKIEVVGIDSSFGVVNVEEDGSFYLKVVADKPFQIRTLDKNNQVVNDHCAWLWLRPNERRGCIGCHENRELAPENKVSLSIKKAPVDIPVEMSNIREKQVELE